MTNQTFPSTMPYKNYSLLVRILLILCVSAFAALGFSSLDGRENLFNGLSVAIELASAAGVGLTAGYFARVLLAGRRPMLKWLVGLAGVLAGLLALGTLTGWRNGIGPLYYNRATIDWRGLGLLLGSAGCSVLAGLAYRNPLRASLPSAEVDEALDSSLPAILSRQDTTPIARTARRSAAPAPKKAKSRSAKRDLGKTKKVSAVKTQKQVSVKQKQPASKPVIRKRSSKKIVLAPVEQHRCPYCLEPVKRNDPRGVVECDVCHTLHHADCWAITGTCQVPHYNH
jgi:ribosomal protein L37AE/L43A